jgi:hypothetical protein
MLPIEKPIMDIDVKNVGGPRWGIEPNYGATLNGDMPIGDGINVRSAILRVLL